MPATAMAMVAAANPSVATPVTMSPFSGPKNSPFDAKAWASTTWPAVLGAQVNDPNNLSTGALSTGIGYGLNTKSPGVKTSTLLPAGTQESGFDDDEIPGVTLPAGGTATDARLTSIGGGRCNAPTLASNGIATPNPWNAQPLLGFGGGGSRDAGAGPAFTGFSMKMVTAAADIAVAGVVETGFVNRSGTTLKSGDSQFGSAAAASTAPA